MKRFHTGERKQDTALGHMDSNTKPEVHRRYVQSSLQVDVGHDGRETQPQSQSQPRYYNIDRRDKANVILCSQYSPEMFAHFRENEEEGVINSKYMVQQAPYITSSTRARIICAMIEVDGALSLPSEALYLAVRIFDNFLSKRPLGAHYQNVFMTPSADAAIANYSLVRLIAVGCFRIAMKFETSSPPSTSRVLREFCLTHSLTKREVTMVEFDIITGLGGYFHFPTIFTFLCRFVRAGFFDKSMVNIACYIAEKALLSSELLNFLPSMLAACCVFITRKYHEPSHGGDPESGKTTGESSIGGHDNRRFSTGKTWTPTLEHYTAYSHDDLRPCISALEQLLRTGLDTIPTEKMAVISADSSVERGAFASFTSPSLIQWDLNCNTSNSSSSGSLSFDGTPGTGTWRSKSSASPSGSTHSRYTSLRDLPPAIGPNAASCRPTYLEGISDFSPRSTKQTPGPKSDFGVDDPALLRTLMDVVDKKYESGRYGKVAFTNDLPR